ncbi:hypothetical protein [Peptostreptococcus faecalis]|uniref:hypothetical protein n=1 Tax=Peptostreptococcus faecalis TaxID=2045015 RepID=UPI0015E070C5|nr:hypothetical protein [Peptostreptococcus faecalis]
MEWIKNVENEETEASQRFCSVLSGAKIGVKLGTKLACPKLNCLVYSKCKTQKICGIRS